MTLAGSSVVGGVLSGVFLVGSFINDVAHTAQTSIITLGAIALSLPAIWRYLLRPMRRLYRQVTAVHTVILGSEEEGIPSLTERLASQDSRLKVGDSDFERIESKVDIVAGEVEEVGRRVDDIKGVLDVIGSTERLEIRTAIAAAASPRPRRHDDPPPLVDPPPPPTPIR